MDDHTLHHTPYTMVVTLALSETYYQNNWVIIMILRKLEYCPLVLDHMILHILYIMYDVSYIMYRVYHVSCIINHLSFIVYLEKYSFYVYIHVYIYIYILHLFTYDALFIIYHFIILYILLIYHLYVMFCFIFISDFTCINHLRGRWINEARNLWTSESEIQWTNESMNQWALHWLNKSNQRVNESIAVSTNQRTNHWTTTESISMIHRNS